METDNQQLECILNNQNYRSIPRDLGKFGTFITITIKFLGLIIENSLAWEGHIEGYKEIGYSFLYVKEYQTIRIYKHFKNYLLLLFLVSYDIRLDVLGKFIIS
jgi:hypothetical protein